MQKKKKIISIILINIGLLIPTTEKYDYYMHNRQEKILIKKYEQKENNPYLLIIEIPKINIKKGVYNINDNNNDINKNIKILNNSNPDKNLFILASHSGTSDNAYFNNINKLINNDTINIYYNNQKYIYKVSNKYYINKTGYLETEELSNNKLLLITCSTTNENKQLIIESNNVYIE